MSEEEPLEARSKEDLLMHYVLGEAPREHRELLAELNRRGLDASAVLDACIAFIDLIAKGGDTNGVD